MSGFHSIVIAGTTSFVGKRVTQAFLTTPGWTVHILISQASLTSNKAVIEQHVALGAQLIVADVLKAETYLEQLAGIDVVFSILAKPMNEHQIALAKAAKAAGVKLFLPSEFGFDHSNALLQNPIYEEKRKVRRVVEDLGLQYMYIIPGPFYEHLYAWPDWGIDVLNKKVRRAGEPDVRVTSVSAAEVAALLPHIVNDPDNINKSVKLGHTVTTGEIFDLAQEAIGDGVQVSSVTVDDLRKLIAEAPSEGESFAHRLMLDMVLGRVESLEHIDGTKYGKPFTQLRHFVPELVRKIQDGSFSLNK